MDAVAAHEHELTGLALEGLAAIPGVRVVGPVDTVARGGAVSFVVDGIHPHDVGQVLDDLGVEVRVGHHCAWPLIRRFDVPATTRATFYLYNDASDVQALLDGVRHAQEFFGVAAGWPDAAGDHVPGDHPRPLPAPAPQRAARSRSTPRRTT